MKKTIALFTMVATGVALASAVESTATFGVLKITSSTYETAISVPWVAAGSTDGETIKVKDLVKTSNLTAGTTTVGNENADGDRLLLYSPALNGGAGGYKGWFLNSSGAWEGANISYNNINAVGGNDEDTLTRGDALILIRQSVSDPAIYLYGQYKGTDGDVYAIASSTTSDKTTLFAPVNTTTGCVYLNASAATAGEYYLEWGNPEPGDQISIQDGSGNVSTITYRNKASDKTDYKWRLWTGSGYKEDFAIQPGMGAWYRAVKTDSARTVTATRRQKE